MKQLKLSNGGYAIVDDKDYSTQSQWKWKINKHSGQVCRSIWLKTPAGRKGGTLLLAKEIMGITNTANGLKQRTPINLVHINKNKLDCRRSNLIKLTTKEKGYNAQKWKKPTTSKYKGVCWDKSRNMWCASLMKDYKTIFIGRYKNEEIAALAYNEKAKKLFGEYANLNKLRKRFLGTEGE